MGSVCSSSTGKGRYAASGGGDAGAAADAGGDRASGGSAPTARSNLVTSFALGTAEMLTCVARASRASPDRILTCGDDRVIHMLDVGTGATVRQWKGHTRCVNKVVYCDARRILASASRDLTVRLWASGDSDGGEAGAGAGASEGESAKEGGAGAGGGTECLAELKGHELTVSGLGVTADGQWLCSGSRDTSVRVWDVETRKQLRKGSVPRNLVTCMQWLPTEKVIAQGAEDLKVRFWDPREGSMRPATTWEGYVYFPLSIDVSPDGNYVLTSSKGFNSVGCEAKLWDRRAGKVLREFPGHQQDAVACCFLNNVVAPAGAAGEGRRLFATASKDETVRVWDANRDAGGACLSERREAGSGAFTSLVETAPGGKAGLIAGSFSPGLFAYTVSPEGSLACVAAGTPGQ